jgi:deoxyribose-phosphate aldolase
METHIDLYKEATNRLNAFLNQLSWQLPKEEAKKSVLIKEPKDIAGFIEHTNLKAFATSDDIKKLCAEAIRYSFKAVCIPLCHVSYAVKLLKDSDVIVCTVIGFPLGNNPTDIKVLEAKIAKKAGAKEIDMVLPIHALKDQDYQSVYEDINKVVLTLGGQAKLKVILETAYLTDLEIVLACMIAEKAGADFVKTSTGFANEGATVDAVELMRATVGPGIGVKAAGGINNFEFAKRLIISGANRLGTSNSMSIIKF